MLRILISTEAKKQLKKIDRRYQKAISKAIDRLSFEPRLGKALRGEFEGLLRLRVSRYRIIYQPYFKRKMLFIIAIEHRKEVYRR